MIVVNASNISKGGSEQVTLSIISYLNLTDNILVIAPRNCKVLLQSLSDNNIRHVLIDYSPPSNFIKYFKYTFSLYNIYKKLTYNSILNVFGPVYFFWDRSKTISGFANAAIFTNNNKSSIRNRILHITTSLIKQFFLFFESKYFWVESNLAMKMLHTNLRIPQNRIIVAFNAPSTQFVSYPFKLKKIMGVPKIFYPAVYRVHKNHILLAKFLEFTKLDIELWVTMDAKSYNEVFKGDPKVKNLGYINHNVLPFYYDQSDIIINTSELEIFSAVLIESHVALRPLISVDEKYAYDLISSEGAFYFMQNNLQSLESTIRFVVDNYIYLGKKLQHLRESTLKKYSPMERALIISNFSRSIVNKNNTTTLDA